MKPFTKEQFEIIKDWVWAARLNCTHDAMHSIEQHAYDLLVNDSEPEKVEGLLGAMGIHPGEQVVQDFLGSKYFNSEGEQAGIHLTNALGLELNGKYHPVYNPVTHMLVPRVWSEEENIQIIDDIFSNHKKCDGASSSAQDIHYAITKVFGGEK